MQNGTITSYLNDLVQESYIDTVTESDIPNNDNNTMPSVSYDKRQPLSDPHAFSELYDKGLLDKSSVSKHLASQKQDMWSTLTDLMGSERVRRARSSMFSKTDINAWIDASKIYKWNNDILVCNINGLPSYMELARTLLFNTENLGSTIADSNYEDMKVNAIVCYHFAALVAAVARQDKPIYDKLKENYDTSCEFFGFMTNCGANSVFAVCCAVINILRAIMLTESDMELDSGCKAGAEELQACQVNNPNFNYNLGIGNSFKENYVNELCQVLLNIQKRHGYCLTQEDADAFKFPRSLFMGDTFPSYQQPNDVLESKLEETLDEIERGCKALELTMDAYEKNDCDKQDSLVERFQVESSSVTEESFDSVSIGRLVKMVTENNQFIPQSLATNNIEKAVEYIATNVVIEEKLLPNMTGNIQQIDRVLSDMRYKNQRYTSIVETSSSGLVSQYIREHENEIIDNIFKRV